VHAYEWIVLRVVPRVERCEFINAGVVVYCQQLDYLACHFEVDEQRARAIDPDIDLQAVRRHLAAIGDLCMGAPNAGANASRPPGERFRWLAAPRSTVVQTSPVHTGLTDDPAEELARLFDAMVRTPRD
jgi:hypothetical protein